MFLVGSLVALAGVPLIMSDPLRAAGLMVAGLLLAGVTALSTQPPDERQKAAWHKS